MVTPEEVTMDFRICGLDYEPFAPLFEMSERDLREHGSVRRVAPPASLRHIPAA
jgi:hypothetical protein